MTISIDPATKVITIPQADCTLVSGSLYKLPTKTVFRAQVISWLASEEGIVFQDAIDHNSDYTVFGVTYAPKVEVINNYSVTFTPDTFWTVLLEGSNNNLADVENAIRNTNNVTVVPNNSAGLIITATSGLTAGEAANLDFVVGVEGGKQEITTVGGGTLNVYDEDNTTLIASFELYNASGARTSNPALITRRERIP